MVASDGPLRELDTGRILLVDGGTGSELRRRGFPMSADAWSGLAALTHESLLIEIHADYVRAGADVITTNTFGTTRFVLEAAGLGEQFEPINRASVQAARKARDAAGRDVAIAGSISCMAPRFDVSAYPDAATERNAYVELAQLFAEERVDLIALEMMQDTRHARRACEAVVETGLPFWLGVSCRFNEETGSLVGFDFPEIPLSGCLDALLPFAPSVVNAMHSPPQAIARALAEIQARWSGPVGAYPELRYESPVGPEKPMPPCALAALAEDWIARGARVLGGCCGTTPEHIRALRAVVDSRPRQGGIGIGFT